MRETAAFKFDSLPGWTFAITRYITAETDPTGLPRAAGEMWYECYQDGESGQGCGVIQGPLGPPDMEKPFVPGGRVTFTFRSLPSYTFWATRLERQSTAKNHVTGETTTLPEGWLRIGYVRDGDDEEVELCGRWGPRADGEFGPRLDGFGRPTD